MTNTTTAAQIRQRVRKLDPSATVSKRGTLVTIKTAIMAFDAWYAAGGGTALVASTRKGGLNVVQLRLMPPRRY